MVLFLVTKTTTVRRLYPYAQQQQVQQVLRQKGTVWSLLSKSSSTSTSRENLASSSSSSSTTTKRTESTRNKPLIQLPFPQLSSRRIITRSFVSTSPASRDLKICIVGSGPSGCYTAKYLQSGLLRRRKGPKSEEENNNQQPSGATTSNDDENDSDFVIDILEKLPTPYGLVRYGVAPDHPEVKNVQNDFDKLFSSPASSAADLNTTGRIRFWGNVRVGVDVTLPELRQLYDIVVLAYGCEGDRSLRLKIQNTTSNNDENNDNDVIGILSAREFVAWYNGHPEFQHVGEKVAQALKLNKEQQQTQQPCSVVVVGQGNVALDCARILAKAATADNSDSNSNNNEGEESPSLFHTDLTRSAWELLSRATLSDISIVGRRGHVQGAFTIKEVRELTQLPSPFHVLSGELDRGMTPASQKELESSRPRQRLEKVLRDAAAANANDKTETTNVRLRFLLNPVEWQVEDDDSSSSSKSKTKLAGVICERTELQGEPNQQRAVGTGQFESIPAQLALVSIGYKGLSFSQQQRSKTEKGGEEWWFDQDRGTVRHERGRIEKASSSSSLGGLYASGWLKRGPTGIIGTNIGDAKDTVATILNDLQEIEEEAINNDNKNGELASLLASRGVQVVDWEGYQRINQKETTEKRSEMQPREKITNLDEMLNIALNKN